MTDLLTFPSTLLDIPSFKSSFIPTQQPTPDTSASSDSDSDPGMDLLASQDLGFDSPATFHTLPNVTISSNNPMSSPSLSALPAPSSSSSSSSSASIPSLSTFIPPHVNSTSIQPLSSSSSSSSSSNGLLQAQQQQLALLLHQQLQQLAQRQSQQQQQQQPQQQPQQQQQQQAWRSQPTFQQPGATSGVKTEPSTPNPSLPSFLPPFVGSLPPLAQPSRPSGLAPPTPAPMNFSVPALPPFMLNGFPNMPFSTASASSSSTSTTTSTSLPPLSSFPLLPLPPPPVVDTSISAPTDTNGREPNSSGSTMANSGKRDGKKKRKRETGTSGAVDVAAMMHSAQARLNEGAPAAKSGNLQPFALVGLPVPSLDNLVASAHAPAGSQLFNTHIAALSTAHVNVPFPSNVAALGENFKMPEIPTPAQLLARQVATAIPPSNCSENEAEQSALARGVPRALLTAASATLAQGVGRKGKQTVAAPVIQKLGHMTPGSIVKLLEDQDVVNRRLARKAEQARVSRRRKKMRLSDLESENTQLRSELEHVKAQLAAIVAHHQIASALANDSANPSSADDADCTNSDKSPDDASPISNHSSPICGMPSPSSPV